MGKIIDNQSYKLGDDLKKTIKDGDIFSVCSSLFSMYAFETLKKELEEIETFRFIFTEPLFLQEENDVKQQKYFEIRTKILEKSLGGSEFEIKLKNEMTGRAIARECSEWIKKKAVFKSNISGRKINSQMILKNQQGTVIYSGTNEFSTAGLGDEDDGYLNTYINKESDFEATKGLLSNFESLWRDDKLLKDVTDQVQEYIVTLHKENSAELIYYLTLQNIFNEFLESLNEDEVANDKTGYKNSKIWNLLYDFQKDAALGIIHKLEKHNGCILADSVGLGKTFTALSVMKYYQERNKSILVLCPKKLSENWNAYKSNYKDNILQEDRLDYDVLFHTDLSRDVGISNGLELNRINWGNYDLLVIDESHNFRNNNARKNKETRYSRMMNKIIKSGVKTKVLMLSATPVNNRFTDLKNQLAFAYEGETNVINPKINKEKSIDSILRGAQTIFNEWSKLPVEQRTSMNLLSKLNLNFDFFKLLDDVTIARSRNHIEKYYSMEGIGKFPKRLPPISKRSELTDIENFMSINDIAESLSELRLSIYTPFKFILASKVGDYEEKYDTKVKEGSGNLRQADREESLKKLMMINFLKRLESSIASFRITMEKMVGLIDGTLEKIDRLELSGDTSEVEEITNYEGDYDIEEFLENDYYIGDKVKIDLMDMNTIGWKSDLERDSKILHELLVQMEKIDNAQDLKLQALIELIENKIANPINDKNRKIIIFSAYADTAVYLYKNLASYLKEKHSLDSALITGSGKNETTANIKNVEFNTLLTNFSPISKNRANLDVESADIDVLIATDCISEGQNLQDCDYLINYDIHWNPVRIIQRFGRIDRIGSINEEIQLVNFWPNMSLDDYINLQSRVESRMHALNVAATGEDNVLTNQSNDMEYRKEQLKKLQEEVVDLEDMNTGVSITDLGLNDFRMDLLDYTKKNRALDNLPNGMHCVVPEDLTNELERGVIFVLKNINNHININNMNQLHPFYLVYIADDGRVISDHLNVKDTLNKMRKLSKVGLTPFEQAYREFNSKTKEGKDMKEYSQLLSHAIGSIIQLKEETDIDSLFKPGGTTMLKGEIKGLEDFELISFVVIV